MDLRQRLSRWALARPSVLMVDPPGTGLLRWRVEAELDRRGWSVARSPADADLLLVLAEPGPELASAVDVLWSQIPLPRRRADVGDGDDVGTVLDGARVALADLPRQASADTEGPTALLNGVQDSHHQDGEQSEDGDGQHEGHEQGHEHGHDVDGLPMAGTAPDRDGLELDSVRVSLGPLLPVWPTGLVVDGYLQGDVLTGVDISWSDGAPLLDRDEDPAPETVALDRLARFLDVAGWPALAVRARRARDGLLSGSHSDVDVDADAARHLAHMVADRVRRSATLRWSVSGIDGVLDRVYGWCDIVSPDVPLPSGGTDHTSAELDSSTRVQLDELAARLDGAELAAVRLIVASLDVGGPTLPARAPAGDEHGGKHGGAHG